MSGSARSGRGAIYYTVIGSFIGGAAGGAWLGLVFMSLSGLYGNTALWEDLLAGLAAGTALVAFYALSSRAAGRIIGMRVMFVAAVAVLNVVAVLYLFGDWVCVISPAGPAFSNCRIPAPLGGLSLLRAILLVSPYLLATILGTSVTVRGLFQAKDAE